ncbi:MAG: sensor histidine kinase [Methyloligellaceae bacterium]
MSASTGYSKISERKEASANRRQMARKIREARDKISEKQTKQEFEYDLLQMFARNELKTLVPGFALIIISALTCMIWAPYTQVLIWISALVITKLLAISLCYKFTTLKREKTDTLNWKTRLAAAEFLYGTTLAYISFLNIDSTIYLAHFFIVGCVITSVSIRMMAAAPVKPIAYAGTIPITAGLVIYSITISEPIYWAIAVIAVILHAVFAGLVKNLHSNIIAMLTYRAEKDYLIAEIEEAKAFSDEARRQAEEANIAKSRFLATMSHELRTPLNAILGFSEVMKDELFGEHQNPTYKDYSRDIHDSGQHLLNLINEILDLSRIEAGRYDLHEESFRLSDVAVDCCRLLRIKADKKSLQIIENYSDQKTKVWADERAIRQIILNLLSNAVKFTPSGGMIILTISLSEGGRLILHVKDNGPGIPKDEVPIILSNFGQGSLAHETAEGGSGLGLPIVKALVEMHEGEFELQSELRKGTDVFVYIPSSRVTQILPQLPVNDSASSQDANNLLPFISPETDNKPEAHPLENNVTKKIPAKRF